MPHKYGPKRHSKLSRGFHRKDKGKHHNGGSISKDEFKITGNNALLKKYIFMYNWYVRMLEIYNDPIEAQNSVMDKFGCSDRTFRAAKRTCIELQELQKRNSYENRERKGLL